jgi:hypothetical protein
MCIVHCWASSDGINFMRTNYMKTDIHDFMLVCGMLPQPVYNLMA